MRPTRILMLIVVLLLAVMLAATVAFASTRHVGVSHKGSKFHFTPSTLTIKKGTTVKWKWSGKIPHNVTGKGFHSKTASKLTFKHKFTKKGTYRVVCTIHEAFGQKMTIRVK
jgi:plastocyanin